MHLIEVKEKATIREFLEVPIKLYKGEPHWIRPLDKDIEEVFDPAQNKSFRGEGEAIRWILRDHKEEPVGRVAAFINPKIAHKNKQPTGTMGFFECINNREAAFKLFDACRDWLSARGMEAMDGPVNFGERDKWWGCLVDGFDIDPNYNCNYNFPYYHQLFESYGFRDYFRQFTFSIPVMAHVPDHFRDKAERIARDPKYSFRHIDPKNMEEYAEALMTVYNKAWAKHPGTSKIRKQQAMGILKKMKPVMDKDIVWFAYYDDEPVGFFIMLPELNQLFRYVNGRLDLIGKLKFLYHKWRGHCRKMFGVVFGVTPEHQGKGLEGAIVIHSAAHIQQLDRYDILEMNWIGDFNPKMIRVCETLGAKVAKTHITYRLLFDPEAEFERHKVL